MHCKITPETVNTSDKNRKLPAELDPLLNDLSDPEIEQLHEAWKTSKTADQPAVDEAALNRVWANITKEIDATPDKAGERLQVTEPVHQHNQTVHNLEDSATTNPNATHKKTVDRPPVRNQRTARIVPMRWMAIAATILLGAVGMAYFLNPITVTAPRGEMAEVVLHDGTRVELNSGATLSYGKRFGRTRRVSLDGEAFFDVVKSEKPFVVETFNASVQVLGTTFNVRAWENEPASQTKVALVTGRVALAGREANTSKQTLLPGQTGVVDGFAVSISGADTVQVSRAQAWRSGNFFFSDEWLGAILSDVERRFDTSIQVTPANLTNKRLKLSLEKPASAEAVVNDISELLGMKYRETSTGYEIFDPN